MRLNFHVFQWCAERKRRRREELHRLVVEAISAAFTCHFLGLLQRSLNFESKLMDALDPITAGVTSLETAVGTLKADNSILIEALKTANVTLASIANGAVVDPVALTALNDRIHVLLGSVQQVDAADVAAVAPAAPPVTSPPVTPEPVVTP